ncbi:MAG: hypothetical protein NXI22_00360 [bacterium]|nr:hypothetical protein [bacterium]
MTQQPNNREHDWVRLKPAKPGASMGTAPPALQPLEEPVNHSGYDLSSLPPMREALLNITELQALFADLKQHAEHVQFVLRGESLSEADKQRRFDAVIDRLEAGGVSRIQIRYRWRRAHWIDTIDRQEAGFRLIRIVHVDGPQSRGK